MDFIIGLPTSKIYNALLVVVDKFNKYGHFIPLKHFIALQIAQLFMSNVYKLHGLPKAITRIEKEYSLVLCGKSCLDYLILS